MIDGGTGLIWHGHHSLFDASSMPSFFDAVERTLSGKPDTNTSLVPHKLWADSLYNLSSSQSKCSDFDRLAYEAASQCADQSHLTRGRSLFRNARQNGPCRSTGWVDWKTWVPGPERKAMDDPPADGVEGIVHVCNLPSGVRQLLKSLHRPPHHRTICRHIFA